MIRRLFFLTLFALPTLAVTAQSPTQHELFELARSGSLEELTSALEAGADPNSQNEYGHTPLMYAAGSGNAVAVQALVSYGADINIVGVGGLTALKLAQDGSFDEIVAYLLAHGATATGPESDHSAATTAEGAQPPTDPHNSDKVEPYLDLTEPRTLFDVARDGPASQVAALISEGADVEMRDEWGQTPIMYAATADNDETLQALLRADADVNASSPAGWTPLMYAMRDAITGEAIRLLISNGADRLKVNEAGQTAFELANAVARATLAQIDREVAADEARRRAEAQEELRQEQERRARLAAEAEAAEFIRYISTVLRENHTELRHLTNNTYTPPLYRAWESGINFDMNKSTWIAAWYENRQSRRLYLIDMATGRYCSWTGTPQVPYHNSAWALVVGLTDGKAAAISIYPYEGTSRQVIYWVTIGGRCQADSNYHVMH